jgi:hypothetical protein
MAILNRLVVLSTLALTAICAGSAAKPAPPQASLVRVPGNGIQPQVVERDGVIHLLYFSGDAEHGDLNYVRSLDYGKTFSPSIRVNSNAGSSIAVGNIRGAQLAIGRSGRVHVAWNGSSAAQLRGPGDQSPMLYARLNDAGSAFEPERNLISAAWGIDGGGTIAADSLGNVYVFWHAPIPGRKGEENRRVWMAKSTDDGRTFAKETLAFDSEVGACGCCGMRAFAGADGVLHVLFRSALETVHRDMYLLTSSDRGRTFSGAEVSKWNIGACVMSSESLAQFGSEIFAAWESEKQVYFGRLAGAKSDTVPSVIGAPGAGENRKYPHLAANMRGEVLLAWTENMAWKKGGSVAWQVFDRDLKAEPVSGRADGVPVWSLTAAFAKPDGGFVVLY